MNSGFSFPAGLVCPLHHVPLDAADAALLSRLNAACEAGRLRTRAGRVVCEPLEAALVTRDGQWAYPVRGGLAVLLVDEAMPATAE